MTFHSGVAKRLVILCALFPLVPVAMWATSSRSAVALASQTCVSAPANVCITNAGGTAVGGTTGLVLGGIAPGSVVTTVTAVGGHPATGALAFTTGAGTLSAGGVFAPGTLTINVINWNNFSGVLFRGTFGDPTAGIIWAFTGTTGTGSNQSWNYTLTGVVVGTWYTGATVSGATAQLFFSSKAAYNGGPIALTSGTASILTPEPASIAGEGEDRIVLLRPKVYRHPRKAPRKTKKRQALPGDAPGVTMPP